MKPIHIGTSTLLWQELGTQTPSLQSWAAFIDFVAEALATSESQSRTHFGFHLENWYLDHLEPSAAELKQLHANLINNSNRLSTLSSSRSLDLLISSQCQITPTLFRIDQAGAHKVTSSQASEFWNSASAQQAFANLTSHLTTEQAALFQHLMAFPIFSGHATDSLEEWLTRLQTSLGQARRQNVATSLWAELATLNQVVLETLQEHNWQTLQPTMFDFAQNPLASNCRFLEATPPTGGVYSIGAGQMVSILDYTRQLMDRHKQPISMPLLADNRAFAAVAELVTTGQRPALLNDLWINPEDRKPIAVHRDILRQELIAKYQPTLLFLNVKAQALPAVLTDDFCQFLASLPYAPILVMPSKSYTAAGATPYQIAYQQLEKFSKVLAQQLTVLGGFYAAPSILTGDHVHLTIAAQRLDATVKLAEHLCSSPLNSQGTTVHDGALQLEIIEGFAEAALLMAGGANKNFLTYTSARTLLRSAFAADHTDQPTWFGQISQQIQTEAAHNIQFSDIIANQLLALSETSPTNQAVDSSPGLRTDFIHCLPLSSQGICSLVEETYRLLRHLLRTPPAQRATVAAERLESMIDHIRTDPQRLLGTRNARDGFIDELLLYFFYAWQEHKNRIPLTLDFARFYDRFYPSAWKGDAAQEGRNGILPVIVRASLLSDLKKIQWPEVLHQAWSLYCPLRVDAQAKVLTEGKFHHWHTYLFSLLEWVIDYCKEDDALITQGRARLARWCSTTRAQSLQEVPQILFELEKGLHQDPLIEHCQRILRDCQYRDRQ